MPERVPTDLADTGFVRLSLNVIFGNDAQRAGSVAGPWCRVELGRRAFQPHNPCVYAARRDGSESLAAVSPGTARAPSVNRAGGEVRIIPAIETDTGQ